MINAHGRVAFLPLVRFRLVAPRPKPYPENPRIVGEHIKRRRVKLGLTQAQAAARLGVKSWTVLNWETGRFDPPIRSMPTIFEFLGYYPFPWPTTVGEQLLRKRRELGWPINQAAGHLGVDPTAWRDWERGAIILYSKHRLKVAQLLGLDHQELTDQMQTRWSSKHQTSERQLPPKGKPVLPTRPE